MTEKEKMLAGEIYSAVDPQLLEELMAVKEMIHDYNLLRSSEIQKGKEILKRLLGHVADDDFLIVQPFYCDYDKQINLGKRFFANFNFTVLDEASVTIGDDCFIGPNVSIYTACHSTNPVERNSRREWAEPVIIGDVSQEIFQNLPCLLLLRRAQQVIVMDYLLHFRQLFYQLRVNGGINLTRQHLFFFCHSLFS